MPISSARQFYERAIKEGAPFLALLVVQRAHENEWLDFKSGDKLGDEQIKSLWSKAICGFANNQGGVVVWGIDARFDKSTEVDAANEVKHVDDPAALRSRLATLHPGATEPPVPGVESVPIFSNGDSGEGFVVSYVPESDSKPHRAELIPGKPYYLRIGDSFQMPGPSILRNLFHPRSAPRLQMFVRCEWQIPPGAEPPDIEILYRLVLRNTGMITAREIVVIAKTLPQGLRLDLPYGSEKIESDVGEGIDVGRHIHPLSLAQIGVLRQTVRVARWASQTTTEFAPSVPARAFAAYFQIFAADMLPSKQQVAFGDSDVKRRRDKEAKTVTEFDPEFYSGKLRTH